MYKEGVFWVAYEQSAYFMAATIGSGATDAHYVNGYANTSGNAHFTFPVGNGTVHAPARVQDASTSNTYDCAYCLANPTTINGSANNVFQIIEYLHTHTETKAILKGYANLRVNEVKNLDLSKRRAQNVSKIIVASGINETRIAIAAEGGVDATYSNAQTGLNLARRVNIIILK